MKNPSNFTKEQLARFASGEELYAQTWLGAHCLSRDGREGVAFAVWAPAAKAVSLVGDFNDWQPGAYPLTRSDGGIWHCFRPGLGPGTIYKYALEDAAGTTVFKADPYAFQAEVRPGTASVIAEINDYRWQDKRWLASRRKKPFRGRPINIYELHLGSWKRKADGSLYTYRELADLLLPYVTEMGYTHVELMPVMEHPFDGSWGYQITGYFAATSRYGTPEDLMYLIDRLHEAKIGVIFDWVPGHFCKDRHGLARFDGTPLYEKEHHAEWGTYTFDFSRGEVRSFLLSNALFWLEAFHGDGLRVDGVSSMLYLNYGRGGHKRKNALGGDGDLDAIAFIRKLNESVLTRHPDVLMIAEESSAWPLVTYPPYDGGLGFHYKWNMGWMNDTLRYSETPFDRRGDEHTLLTFSMMYAFSENYVLPFSHDEVVHGKKSLIGRMPGDYEAQFAGLRLLFCQQFTHPGAKLTFMGNEFGQFIEWKYDQGLDWLLLDYEKHRQLRRFVITLHRLYEKERPLWERDDGWEGFQWLDADNSEQNILLFLRRGRDQSRPLAVVLNFSPTAYEDYWVGVPGPGSYREILNSDEIAFGGKGRVNPKRQKALRRHCHGQDYAVNIKVPALGAVLLKGKTHAEAGAEEKTEKK